MKLYSVPLTLLLCMLVKCQNMPIYALYMIDGDLTLDQDYGYDYNSCIGYDPEDPDLVLFAISSENAASVCTQYSTQDCTGNSTGTLDLPLDDFVDVPDGVLSVKCVAKS